MLTEQSLNDLLAGIDYPGYEFLVMPKGDGFLLQTSFYAVDADDPDSEPVQQKSRKWYVSAHSTKSEIVETCYAAVCRAVLHEVAESFRYNGRRVYSPHFDVEARVAMCDAVAFDVRK